MDVQGWIAGDETAKEMLSRVMKERPFMLLPPLHRVPLRVGNVVEIVGPSPSAKTQILIQTAISGVLPKEWNGVNYGGLGKLVMFIDLDCRFDILRFSEVLKHRIIEANGSITKACSEQHDAGRHSSGDAKEKENISYDEDLFVWCMRRFLYVRCYNSFEFLSTLKTLHYRVQKESEGHGVGVNFLLIDSIGAYHWIDRVSSSLPLGGNCRKHLSLQSVLETVVQEIKRVMLVHPMLVIATKATILGDDHSVNEAKWNRSSLENSYSRRVTNSTKQVPFREYMPSVWQSFVTHRILVRTADDDGQRVLVYSSEWLQPSLNFSDKFIVRDGGVFIMS